MTASPLIDVATLARENGRSDLVVVDCRFDLKDPGAGRKAYGLGHIPGARYAHLDDDLARHPSRTEGRHPLPVMADFAKTLTRWGITAADTVVCYDEGSGAIAARLWWLLRHLGHRKALVLDGGFAAWRDAGLPEETQERRWPARHYEPRSTSAMPVVATAEVAQRQATGCLLVDARAAPRYRGEQEPIDPVAGHVPGARNRPFASNLDPNGRFRPAAELRAELDELLAGREPSGLIAMCGSGVTACHLLLALEIAGLPGAALYAGSWSEWIRDPSRPIKTGPDP